MAALHRFLGALALCSLGSGVLADELAIPATAPPRWSPILRASAEEPDSLPIPPSMPVESEAEVTDSGLVPDTPEDVVPDTSPDEVFSTPEPPEIEAFHGEWARGSAQQLVEENSFLWRDSSDQLGFLAKGHNGFGLIPLSIESKLHSSQSPGVWIVPRFTWTFASGPTTPDVQAQLFDLRLETNFAHTINDVWTVHFHLAPAFVSDWNNKSRDAFRLIGGGMLAGHVDPHWTVLAGVTALSRFDLPVLPVGGVRWHPSASVEMDAVFPNPRASWRYKIKDDSSEWLYIGGVLAGNQWAVDLAHDQHDRLGYLDYRIVIGNETRKSSGDNSFFEVGYVTQRRLRFDRFGPDRTPHETLIIRWGSRF